jgi:hypothetical protein
LDSFMSKGMASIKTLTEQQRLEMKTAFINAMKTATSIFGDDAFRKRQNRADGRRPINKALFEALSVAFSKLSDEERKLLVERKENFKENFIRINNDRKFFDSLASGTGQKDRVHTRFTEIDKIVTETISNDND